MNSLVSAIITTHDRQDLLVRAVKSVLSQTYKNLELIVVDDASDERADELLREFNLQYIYIPKEESKGGNHARNVGIRAAKGEYIAFLDDDDYWLPTKIEKQVKLIEEKKCGLVYCGKTYENVIGNEIHYTEDYPRYSGDMSHKILMVIIPTTSTILVKKPLLIEVGLFDEMLKYWQEYELSIRLAQKTEYYYVNEQLVVYRVDIKDNNRLSNKYKGWKEAVKYVFNKHHALYKNISFKEKIWVKQMVWKVARYRCKVGKMWGKYIYYQCLIQTSYKINKFIHLLRPHKQ